jgi:hypothetical protein
MPMAGYTAQGTETREAGKLSLAVGRIDSVSAPHARAYDFVKVPIRNVCSAHQHRP